MGVLSHGVWALCLHSGERTAGHASFFTAVFAQVGNNSVILEQRTQWCMHLGASMEHSESCNTQVSPTISHSTLPTESSLGKWRGCLRITLEDEKYPHIYSGHADEWKQILNSESQGWKKASSYLDQPPIHPNAHAWILVRTSLHILFQFLVRTPFMLGISLPRAPPPQKSWPISTSQCPDC